MKVDRYAKDLFKKLDNYNSSTGNGNEYDDDYYIEIGSEPPRFADYRAARAKITDAFGNKTFEDVWDSITQDESDYYLKMNLRMSPEERYRHKKEAWYFHESSWYMRHDNGYDGHGCINGKCIPECRYPGQMTLHTLRTNLDSFLHSFIEESEAAVYSSTMQFGVYYAS